jgi:hypothetical protein
MTSPMEIQAAASLQMLATTVGGARSVVTQLQEAPIPATAPPTEHADAILQLSTAAQALLTTR